MHTWCHTHWNERRYAVEWMEFPSGRNGHNRCIDCECQPVFPCGELTKVQVIHGNLCLQNWIQIPTRDVLDMSFDHIIQQHCAMSTVVLSVYSPFQKMHEFVGATPGFELCSGSSVCYHGRKRWHAGVMGHQLWRNEAWVELLSLQGFPSKRTNGPPRIRDLEDQPQFFFLGGFNWTIRRYRRSKFLRKLPGSWQFYHQNLYQFRATLKHLLVIVCYVGWPTSHDEFPK